MPSGVYPRIKPWQWSRRTCDCGTCHLCKHRVSNQRYYARRKAIIAAMRERLKEPLRKTNAN